MNWRKLQLAAAACAIVACGRGTSAPPSTAAVVAAPPGAPPPSPAGHPRGDLIPRQVLFGNPERTNVQISPDGKFLAWLAPSQGVLNVWVAPIDELADAKVVTADKTRPVRQYLWAFDGKHLLYLQDKGGDENFHLFRVEVASAETTDLTPIEGARVEVYAASERRPNAILVGMNDRDPHVFDVYQIELASGARTRVVQNDQNLVEYVIDHDLKVRFGQQAPPDGSSVLLAYDAKAGTWKEHDRFSADDFMTSHLLGFDKSGTRYYAYDSRERDTAALYLVDAKTKTKKLLFEDAKVDVGDALVHPTTHAVQAVEVNYDRPRWVALDKSVKRDLDAIAKLGDGAGTPTVVSRTLDDKTWIVVIDSDQASPKYFRWNRAQQRSEFLFSVQPALDGQPLVKMHPVVIPARDGLELVSYLSLPKHADANDDGKADTPTPMVLLVHGGPWWRDSWGYNRLHQMLANRGYAVLSVNFRGSTGFGKRFVNGGNGQWGKKMHEDLLDAVAWAVSNGVAPQAQVCIMGGSYGGYATLAGLTFTPDVFACGVDIVGPSSIVTLLETIPPYWQPIMALFHTRVGDPSTEPGKRALLEISPLTRASAIKKPLLIGQGANDPRVKKSESDQIVRALQAKQIPVGYVVFPDEGHGFARPENSIAFFAVTEAFLSVHLGGAFQPITSAELTASSLTVEAGRDSLPALAP
jgi:dipeptidyl aminopeptidase/acylaminoacyl peptidase